jgi:hypothetical protein
VLVNVFYDFPKPFVNLFAVDFFMEGIGKEVARTSQFR